MTTIRIALLALLCTVADAYVAVARPAALRRAPAPAMALSPDDLMPVFNLLAEIVDDQGERVYGAVEAPGWVLPVGGGLAILTALLPVLLAPGDEALNRQRRDEKAVAGKKGAQLFGGRDRR